MYFPNQLLSMVNSVLNEQNIFCQSSNSSCFVLAIFTGLKCAGLKFENADRDEMCECPITVAGCLLILPVLSINSETPNY